MHLFVNLKDFVATVLTIYKYLWLNIACWSKIIQKKFRKVCSLKIWEDHYNYFCVYFCIIILEFDLVNWQTIFYLWEQNLLYLRGRIFLYNILRYLYYLVIKEICYWLTEWLFSLPNKLILLKILLLVT